MFRFFGRPRRQRSGYGYGRPGIRPRRGFVNGRLVVVLLIFLGLVIFFGRGLWVGGIKTADPFSPARGEDFPAAIFCMLLDQGIPGMQMAAREGFSPRLLLVNLVGLLTGIYPDNPGSLLAGGLTGFSAFPVPAKGSSIITVMDTVPHYEDEKDLLNGGDKSEITSGITTFPSHIKPKLLIYHSHITETYFPTADEYFCTNLDITVARLGRLLAESLERDYQIPVMHCTMVFDLPRRTAYQKARPEISKILEENPQINMVVDLHRDGISRRSTTASIDGEEIGNLLIVIGSGHEDWENNFTGALLLQQELEKSNAAISRGILSQGFTYNQDLHDRALLVEVGGHQNSLEEAVAAIPILAEALAKTYAQQFDK